MFTPFPMNHLKWLTQMCPISSTILDYISLDECTLLVFKVNLQTHAFHKSLEFLHLVLGPIDTNYPVSKMLKFSKNKNKKIRNISSEGKIKNLMEYLGIHYFSKWNNYIINYLQI